MITAVIPARGGSKGIRNKNLVDVCGKPLVVWSIEQALAAKIVDRVIVSSDSDEIGAVATHAGAEWLRRSAETASDTATTESVLIEVLEQIDKPDFVALLQPTSPIRQPDDIDSAICKCDDSLFSARTIEGYTWEMRKGLLPEYTERKRRQDNPSVRYEENGSIYVFRPAVLEAFGKRLGGRVGVYEMHPLDSFQVDTPGDLELIRTLLPLRLGAQSLKSTATSTACCARTQAATMQEPSHFEKTFSGLTHSLTQDM